MREETLRSVVKSKLASDDARFFIRSFVVSKRKPFSGDAGYVSSRRARWGYVVVYDRENGGDWIDGETRWVVGAYTNELSNIGLLDCATRKLAMLTMKLAVEGESPEWVASCGACDRPVLTPHARGCEKIDVNRADGILVSYDDQLGY